ncbi:MAG: FAD-binding oxidoreductase [Rothia sp. (in: high G+C Gram-positive bacteria)]|nr:FAD-binding oxidoreductase [Rothia sp. (in: high G+C Gram-positive bacteria)]
MLSEKSRKVIEETLPAMQERIRSITPVFYDTMLTEREDLLDGMFSRVDQTVGTQPRALAGSIVFFANYVLNHPTSSPDEILTRVANKHASLGVPSHEYVTVYQFLFKAIEEDFGDEYTEEFREAWTEIYWMMADALIRIERNLYSQQVNESVNSPFKLVKKVQSTRDVIDLTFEPADDTPLTKAVPGQYVSVIVSTRDGLRQPRQYVVLPCAPNQRRIAVKVDRLGEISPQLAALEIGDVVDISNPYGDVTLDKSTPDSFSSLYIFTQDIGVAPALAFLHQLATENSTRDVVMVHSDKSLASWALREDLEEVIEKLPNARLISFLEAPGEGDFTGEINMRKIDIAPRSYAYLCGSVDFMQTVRSKLIHDGVPGRNVQYEVFGSDQWMHTATRRTMHRRY